MKIERIWSEYKTALKRFLHSKVSNDEDVEDLLQEILIKSYNNFHTIKDHSSVKSWLFQIANNTIIDFYRKKRRNKDLAVENIWHVENDNKAQSELSDCIIPFIKALPEEQANLLTAIDIEKKSQKAYAEELNISYSTLKSKVQKSRTLLKGLFDQCCHFSIDSQGNLYDFEQKESGCNKCN